MRSGNEVPKGDMNNCHHLKRVAFNRLTDSCGIILVSLNIGLHIVWQHQINFMAKLDQLPRPVESGGSRLHTNQTGLLFLEEG